jgi:hypothetical protein
VAENLPVICVDAKRKKALDDFKNAGREWRPQGDPEEGRAAATPRLGASWLSSPLIRRSTVDPKASFARVAFRLVGAVSRNVGYRVRA